ncbi:MAG: hypothetical protein FXF47_09400 [Candidatus Mcinerneyibacterium aminivorans]|uniref:6-bladed beta-propeller n=1 Tax=Candidatus Mcinerneyibacterium aminivorans TaxID=2703815 RepID=A0A5D0M9C2_9BACT|nr:MAG: hypothetical protein FXF47_09400 [Candidatus Mcinerneyibacterium aminivorans]
MKKVFMTILLLIFVFSCKSPKDLVKNDKTPIRGVKKVEIVNVWQAENFTNSNSMLCAGIYKNQIYFLQDLPDEFVINFRTFKGKNIKKIEISKGNGPGEARHSMGLRIYKDRIYFVDITLRRISIFNMDGKFLDSLEMGSDIGPIMGIDIMDNILYFSGYSNNYLGKYDLEGNKIIKELANPDVPDRAPKHGDDFKNGILKIDYKTGKIFYSYAGYPYKIEKYDSDLNKLLTIKKESEESFKKTHWFIHDRHTSIVGDFAVLSMAFDDKYLYGPIHTMSMEVKGKNLITNEIDGEIAVFNKNNGKFVYKLKNEKLEGIDGGFYIFGVTEDYIITTVWDNDSVIKDLLENKNISSGYAFVIFENPVN